MKDLVTQFLDWSSKGLVEYVLTDNKWDAITGLVSALKVRFSLCSFLLLMSYEIQILKDAMTFFSSNAPIIASVIPTMDVIDEVFATGSLITSWSLTLFAMPSQSERKLSTNTIH